MSELRKSRKKRLSRKKLTEEQALDKIANIYMEMQSEYEMLKINLLPIKGKKIGEIDGTTAFILMSDGYQTVDEVIADCEKRIEYLEWKAHEDYGRYVGKGIHSLSSGFNFIK